MKARIRIEFEGTGFIFEADNLEIPEDGLEIGEEEWVGITVVAEQVARRIESMSLGLRGMMYPNEDGELYRYLRAVGRGSNEV